MRRLAAALSVLLFFTMPMRVVATGEPETIWSTDQAINGTVEINGHGPLRIESGVNVTFMVPGVSPPDLEEAVPSVTVNGTLTVNGTEDRPVVFDADATIVEIYPEPPYVYVNGTPDGARFAVRNATFQNLVLCLENASGEISDCAFNSSAVYLCSSQTVFVNCTFSGTYIPIWGEGRSSTSFIDCEYDIYSLKMPKWATAHGVGINLHGDVSMTGCYFRASGTIMHGFAGNFTMADCYLKGGPAYSGIGLYYASGLNPGVRSEFRNATFDGMNLFTETGTLAEGCTFCNNDYGMFIGRIHGHRTIENKTYYNLTDLTLRNNTFYNNSVAIRLEGPAIDLGENRFEDANGTNNTRILEQYNTHYVLVADQNGQWIDYPTIGTLSAFGATESHGYSGFGNSCTVELLELVIDGNGIRQTQYPYTIAAMKDDLTSETLTIMPQNLSLTLVVPVLTDLFPSTITPDRPKVGAGQPVSFSAEVENRGLRNLSYVTAVLYIDGVRYDERNISSLGPNGSAVPAFRDWNATAGRHTIEVRLDPGNLIREYNETNNNLTYVFAVPEPPSPDRTWTNLQLGFGALAVAVILAMYVRMRRRTMA